jgi:spore germination cell wall hydrolase CwlJ-like protein
MKHLLALLSLTTLTLAGPPTEAPAGWERTVLAAVIVAEAGGEGVKGMEAVYEVIWMRGVERKRSLYAVVTQRKQFSCLNSTTTTELVQRMSQHSRYKWVRDELLKFPSLTVHTCPAHLLALNTTRANHYHAKGVTPYWAKNKTPVIIGNHLFYRIK